MNNQKISIKNTFFLRRLLLVCTLFTLSAEAAPLATDSLVVVHASRHYHTDAHTIRTTNQLIRKARARGQNVVALAQNDITSDPDWYTFRGPPEVTSIFPSLMGQHELNPVPAKNFKVTLIGGYHSACLGWTLSEIISRSLQQPESRTIDIVLPMKAIFTGYRMIDGRRVPEDPEMEAKADSSIDGLNLYQVTWHMHDLEFAEFIENTLTWSVFNNAPMREINLKSVQFQIIRNGRLVREFSRQGPATLPFQDLKYVRFHY